MIGNVSGARATRFTAAATLILGTLLALGGGTASATTWQFNFTSTGGVYSGGGLINATGLTINSVSNFTVNSVAMALTTASCCTQTFGTNPVFTQTANPAYFGGAGNWFVVGGGGFQYGFFDSGGQDELNVFNGPGNLLTGTALTLSTDSLTVPGGAPAPAPGAGALSWLAFAAIAIAVRRRQIAQTARAALAKILALRSARRS